MIGLGNLCEFLERAETRSGAAGQVFLPCDAEDLSTGELYRRLCLACGRAPQFVHVPYGLLATALGLAGQQAIVKWMFGNFLVDPANARTRLSWQPSVPMIEGLERTVHWFRTIGTGRS